MELNITDEHLDEVIENIVRKELSDSYESSLYYVIKGKVESVVRGMVENELADTFKKMVDDVVADFMGAKPVDVNDGWGERKRYESYADFFAAKLREQCAKDYQVRRLVEDAVKRKVEEIWKQYEREILEEVIAKHAEEAGNEA